MATSFRQAVLVCGAGALLLAASGCGVEPGSAEEGAIESVTGAVTCDPSPFVGICQSRCIDNRCTDGAVIGACMSACMGAYCTLQVQQQFRPDARCMDTTWLPAPTSPRTPTTVCQDDVLQACQGRCELCNAPTTQDRGACQLNCTNTWCAGGALNACYASNRAIHCDNDQCRGLTGDALYTCLADCLSICQDT